LILPSLCSLLSAVLFVSPMTRVQQIKAEQSTGELTSFPYFSMTINCVLWSFYGMLTSNVNLFCINFFGLCCATYYLKVFYDYTKEKDSLLKLVCGGIIFVGVVLLWAVFLAPDPESSRFVLGLVGSGVCIIMFGSPLSTMRTVILNKNTASMHFGLSLCGTACSLCWFLLGFFQLDDKFVWGPNSVAFVLSCIQMLLFVVYPTKNTPTMHKDLESSFVPKV